MYQFPIGVMLDSFRKSIPDAIREAGTLGVQGMQMYAHGEYAPENVTPEKAKALLALAKENGLVFSAVCGDFGLTFDIPERNPSLIERSERVLDFAKALETNVVTTHIGEIPADKTCDRYKIMQEACFKLCEYADSLGAHFAIETGTETAGVLRAFLDDLHSHGVAVNFDPANLTLMDPHGAVKDVHTLGEYIVHTHAKDAINLQYRSKEEYEHYSKIGRIEEDWYIEVPLGDGDVSFPDYLSALEEVGYRGYLTIEREVGANPAEDIRRAAEYLKSVMQA